MGHLALPTQGLALDHAKESDAQRIADIHMSAFGANYMLLAQFPTPSVREGLRKCLVEKVIEEIRDPKWAILVVRDGQKRPISFAKWCLPIYLSENYEEPPWQWPEGTDIGILNEWSARVDDVGRKVIGDTPCYRLSFMATDPQYERCGAASLLVKWGLELCNKDKVPAVLEGTMNAVPFYQRHGFIDEGEISMNLEGVGPKGESVLYEERSFIFRPSSTAN
ncbi:hypothetical protein FQN49_002774 [Arthroderma sp. PD_2]|nr:hypothetical protein FQN49_002774 [Arthroderma sp. PD_2]